MSDADRRTLAEITSSVRRMLEREDARGLGELLARDATTPVTGRGRRTRVMEAGAAPAARTRTAAANAAPAEPRAAAPAPAPVAASSSEVDLFGTATRPVAPAARPRPAEPEPLTAVPVAASPVFPAATEYHPRGWDVREPVLAASLPVLTTIAAEIHDCRKCGLCETRRNTVPGVGSARSGIVFVGEAPGADEDAQGEPFVGRAGQLLTRIIAAMDDAKLIPGMPLSRETVYICNVLKCRPPENRNPLPNEIEQCAPYLRRQLEVLKPRIICCLGKFAAELLLGVKGTIASMRGRVYTFQGSKMIVTYHPAACLRNPTYKRPVWEDMQLLAREYLTD